MQRSPQIVVGGEAANGAIVLEKVREINPDLVLMHVAMPIVDG